MEEPKDDLLLINASTDLRKIHRLGRGSFSDVYLVATSMSSKKSSSQHRRQELALKQLNLRSLNCQESFNIAATDIIEEARVLSQLDHPNIITLRGISDTDPKKFLSQGYKAAMSAHGASYSLLFDVLAETLQDRLKRWSRDGSSWKKSRFGFLRRLLFQRKIHLQIRKMFERIESVALDVAHAMEFLHKHNIIFQDLKPGKLAANPTKEQFRLCSFLLMDPFWLFR